MTLSQPARLHWATSATVGLLAGAVALGFGELAAGVGGTPKSPLVVVGNRIVDIVPKLVRDAAISLFGTGDKVALLVGIVVVTLLVASALGVIARRRLLLGQAGIGCFGLVGLGAAAAEPNASAAVFVAPVVAALAGIATMWFITVGLSTRFDRPSAEPGPNSEGAADRPGAVSRRRLLAFAGGAVVVASSAGTVGRLLQQQTRAAASRLAVILPRPAVAAPALPAGADLGLTGLSPLFTPNRDFYRIDTSLFIPRVAAEGWSLRIHGMVDREIVFTFDDLLARDLVEADITLACVSNEVGGDLVGTARWLGVPLTELLDEAGVDPNADQVVGRSVDNFTAGFPVSTIRDGRSALVAVGMNGEPLPLDHGFPARLVVAGLYGYVSATKWLSEIELTRFDRFDPYWIRKGWAATAPVKTMARIDTPRSNAQVDRGQVAVAGVAWAPTRDISRVEVQIDDDGWAEASLSPAIGDEAWRQWVFEWDASPGRHRVRVRSTDGDDETQTDERREPFPDGATGWHSVTLVVL